MEDCKFLMTQADWDKIHNYAKIAYHMCPDVLEKNQNQVGANKPWNNEIGGMCVMTKHKDGWLIHDPVILKQEVSGVITILDKDALAEHFCEMREKHGEVRHLWWHSHHMMAANWSGTDENTIEESVTPDWSASLLINLKGDHKLRIQYFQPIQCSVDVEVEILDRLNVEIPKALVEEVFDKVEEQSRSVVTYGGHNTYGGYHYNNYKKSRIQKHQYDPELNLWNQSFGQPSKDGVINIEDGKVHNAYHYGRNDDIDDEFVQRYVDDINTRYIKTEIDYKEWRAAVRESNKSLKEYGVRIIEFKKKKLEQIIYTADLHEFIEYDVDNLPL